MSEIICYCFNYSDEDIIADFIANGKSAILKKVMSSKAEQKCDCHLKNPKGR